MQRWRRPHACSTRSSACSSPRSTSPCAGPASTSRARAPQATSSPAPCSCTCSRRRAAGFRCAPPPPLALGLAVTAQLAFFRYFHAPFDDQAALAARLAWVDVRPVVVHALPVPRRRRAGDHRLRARVALAAAAARPSLPIAAARARAGRARSAAPCATAPTEIRTASAAVSFALVPRPPRPSGGHPPLPPLASRRARVPSILFILTESVRASDWCGDAEPCALSPEIDALLPSRLPLLQMRVDRELHGHLHVGAAHRAPPARQPRSHPRRARPLRPGARGHGRRSDASRYTTGRRTSRASSSARAPRPPSTRSSPRRRMLGHTIEDVEEAVASGLDRRLAEECQRRIPSLEPPYLAIVHYSGTHEPYFFDEATAPFRPFGRVVTWSGLEDLHRSLPERHRRAGPQRGRVHPRLPRRPARPRRTSSSSPAITASPSASATPSTMARTSTTSRSTSPPSSTPAAARSPRRKSAPSPRRVASPSRTSTCCRPSSTRSASSITSRSRASRGRMPGRSLLRPLVGTPPAAADHQLHGDVVSAPQHLGSARGGSQAHRTGVGQRVALPHARRRRARGRPRWLQRISSALRGDSSPRGRTGRRTIETAVRTRRRGRRRADGGEN